MSEGKISKTAHALVNLVPDGEELLREARMGGVGDRNRGSYPECHRKGVAAVSMMHKEKFLDDVWDIVCDSILLGELSWIAAAKVDRDAGKMAFREEDAPAGVTRRIRRADLPAGLAKLETLARRQEELRGYVSGSWEDYAITGVQTQDAGDFDSELADILVQLIVFGEVVYG